MQVHARETCPALFWGAVPVFLQGDGILHRVRFVVDVRFAVSPDVVAGTEERGEVRLADPAHSFCGKNRLVVEYTDYT